MGQDAFLERYKKPNHKIHIVIFLLIIVASIFLSSRVEQSKDKSNFVALKKPVPIDSVTIGDTVSEKRINPTVQPPVTNTSIKLSSAAENKLPGTAREYAFEQQPDLSALDSGPQTKSQVASESDNKPEHAGAIIASQENSTIASDNKQAASSGSLDKVYDQQQDRFFQTLAKSAVVDTKESAEIKRIKQAILQDKPLPDNASASKQHTAEQAKRDPDDSHIATKNPEIPSRKTRQQNKLIANADKGKNLRVAVSTKQSAIAKAANSPLPVLTKRELDNVLSQFTRSYNKGNINKLMALFHENASTNDRSNKSDIEADYAELFNNTRERNLMIKEINWQLRQGKAEGAAMFEVTVQPKNGAQATRYRGQINITAVKKNQDVYITRLLHHVTPQ